MERARTDDERDSAEISLGPRQVLLELIGSVKSEVVLFHVSGQGL